MRIIAATAQANALLNAGVAALAEHELPQGTTSPAITMAADDAPVAGTSNE